MRGKKYAMKGQETMEGGEAFWLKRISSELLELATIIPVDVGVIGKKEEGGKDDMVDILMCTQIKLCQK